MHPRAAILQAIRDALAASTSPALPIFEADETATGEGWQIAEGIETRGDQTTREHYERQLAFRVTAWALSAGVRDAMSEALEVALLGDALEAAGVLEVEWISANLARTPEHVGARTYPATYELVAQYFTGR